MSAIRKNSPLKTRKPRKKRNDGGPRPSVISMRISSQEKKMLEKLARSSSRSVSEIMREAMDCWKASRCQDV